MGAVFNWQGIKRFNSANLPVNQDKTTMKNIFVHQIATILCEELILACVHVTGTADNNSYHTTDVPLPEIISVNAILVLSREFLLSLFFVSILWDFSLY